ncbi:glycine zipper 2TM domain-containing protein [Methylophaga thiooxydans]|uniref:glycine zipper 2TM domain-containing protein n=1 Tax=Methylophaga thiooxydans TaxID=392484 RepID=UPI002353F945|nr:glycine zipper 2TM domain-containing protein [Methylophaga thiooxydans]
MTSTIKTLTVFSSLMLAASAAMAGDRHYDRDYRNYQATEKARVTHVEPIYRTVTITTPQQECWDEPRRSRRDHQSYTSTIAGGIVGGVIGSQFGGGKGKTALAVAGTLLGGSVGRDWEAQNRNYQTGYEEHCRVVERQHREQRIDAYEVSYRYNGKRYTTVMDHHPGKFIPVDVHVEPRHRRYY